jgi:hypothetical protein
MPARRGLLVNNLRSAIERTDRAKLGNELMSADSAERTLKQMNSLMAQTIPRVSFLVYELRAPKRLPFSRDYGRRQPAHRGSADARQSHCRPQRRA